MLQEASQSAGTYVPSRPGFARLCAEIAATVRPPRLDLDTIAARAPRGDGSAVLLLPGVFCGDGQTRNLRTLLARIGYRPYGWGLGRNYGPTGPLIRGARGRLDALAAEHGKVALIGFSMGGLFARWLAGEAPAKVQQVITVGSPWRAAVQSACVPAPVIRAAWRDEKLEAMARAVAAPLPMPVTSLFSRRDGIVAWESCRDPEAPGANVEVDCPHLTMERDSEVFRQIAERLARNR